MLWRAVFLVIFLGSSAAIADDSKPLLRDIYGADHYYDEFVEERTKAIVFEPRVGGSVYEDWGAGSGHLYGQVTAYDPPRACSMRTMR